MKTTFKFIVAFVLASLFLLSSCYRITDIVHTEPIEDDDADDDAEAVRVYAPMKNGLRSFDNYYLFQSSFAGTPVDQFHKYKYDVRTGEKTALCEDPVCLHDTKDCPFFYPQAIFEVRDSVIWYSYIEIDTYSPDKMYDENGVYQPSLSTFHICSYDQKNLKAKHWYTFDIISQMGTSSASWSPTVLGMDGDKIYYSRPEALEDNSFDLNVYEFDTETGKNKKLFMFDNIRFTSYPTIASDCAILKNDLSPQFTADGYLYLINNTYEALNALSSDEMGLYRVELKENAEITKLTVLCKKNLYAGNLYLMSDKVYYKRRHDLSRLAYEICSFDLNTLGIETIYTGDVSFICPSPKGIFVIKKADDLFYYDENYSLDYFDAVILIKNDKDTIEYKLDEKYVIENPMSITYLKNKVIIGSYWTYHTEEDKASYTNEVLMLDLADNTTTLLEVGKIVN